MKYIKFIIIALFAGCLFLTGNAQTRDIELQLIDAQGNPVAYAGAKILNSTADVDISSKKGLLTIRAAVGDHVLITTADLKKKIVQITDSVMNVVISGNDALVSAGKNFFVPQNETTAAVSMIGNEKIMQSSAINLANTLYGLAPGLAVLQNGGTEWENGPTLFIRGQGGLSDNNDVLVLVDGFERSLSSVNKDDVENIQVLKDAAATAIYGYKGINGVILVSTKKGIYNKTEISASYDHAFTSPVGLPKMADAYTYVQAVNEAARFDGSAAKYNKFALDRFKDGSLPYFYPNVNWIDEIYANSGHSNQYNVAIRGGGSKSRYYGSLNLLNNSGFMRPESILDEYNTQILYSKMNARINLDIDITSTTNFIVRMNGILAEKNVPGSGYSELVDNLYTIPAAAYPIKNESGDWGISEIWLHNPYALAAASGNTVYHSRSLASDAELRQRLDMFVKGLSFGAKIGYDNYAELRDATTRQYRSERIQLVYDPVNDPDGPPPYYMLGRTGKNDANAFSSELNGQWRHFNIEASAYYNNVWGKHKLDAAFVYSLDSYTTEGQNNTSNRMSFGLQAHYGYKNRYFIDGLASLSGSNQLPPANKWGVLPAVSGAWIISEEDFLKGNATVNYLKLRASYGIIGRDYRPEANMYRQTFSSGSDYFFLGNATDRSSGMKENRYPSFGLTYEKAHKSNLGVDVNLFKHLALTVDAFIENRRDILVISSGTQSNLLGQSLPYNNVGAVDNKGIDLGLAYSGKSGDFKYEIAGNFAYARSKVIESGESYKPFEYSREKGRPVGQIFGYEAIGYYTPADFDAAGNLLSTLPSNAVYSDVVPGDIKLNDKNGDHIINEYDKTYIGYNSDCPEIQYSASVNIEYKGFGFDALFQGVTNYTAQLTLQSFYRPLSGDNYSISDYYYNNRWTPETPNARFPRLTLQDNPNNTAMSTVWIADRSFAKLRHAELYYKFSNDWLFVNLGINDVKLYVRGIDLLSFSGITELDPEIMSRSYPASRSINLGVKLIF
ncbi:MAG: SusC/RagA family TonB-linked outer membrane protein [Dysgonamonadaceae bacterium]|jgi:TonB-linked SusC/RagA family outer membrane protein|nr:SusC/RagA family TonB-linked outer membrane protein [Dysgonamonadaceae bacterium]